MSEVAFTEPLHDRIAGLVKHLEGEYPPHVLADVSGAATLIEEQAKELYLLRNENSNLRDNVGEQAARIAELEAALDSDPDGSGYWRFWSGNAAEQANRATASQARLSEAVKVLERLAEGEMSDAGHTALRDAAKAFLATLGEET